MASFMFSLIDAMKSIKYILATFLLLGSICLSGQNLQKYYTSKNLEDGLLYFIKPMKLYKTCQNACYFDQTILPKNDTVSVGMTLTNKETFRVDSIAFLKDSIIIKRKVKHLYTEQSKKKWNCRIFIYLTRDELNTFFTDLPPVLSFYGMGGSNVQLQVKPNDWKKILEINRAIYSQIRLNEM